VTREEGDRRQLGKLQRLVAKVLESNAFYQDKLAAAGVAHIPDSRDAYRDFPYTTKGELVADRDNYPPYGSNLTYPLEEYTRFCQTSGTSGDPMPWLDTNASWSVMLDCWQSIFCAAGVSSYDRVFFAFSFGPFLGFWTAYEAACRMGCLALPGGGMSGTARLACMETNAVTALCCTPTYALRLGESIGGRYPELSVGKIIVAGEPGGSIPATRDRISELWGGAEVYDHHGMTEVGPVSYPAPGGNRVLGVLEEHYLAEVVDQDTGNEVGDGDTGELILTTLGRDGCPLLRYQTGDLVRKCYFDDPARGKVLGFDGGVLGRIDDMVVVRGVNVYPSAIETVLRRFPEILEYQVCLSTERSMTELGVVVEPASPTGQNLVPRVENALGDALALRIPVSLAEPGSLPRFEFKAQRWVSARVRT